MSCIDRAAAAGGYSHDNLFDTLLDMFGVSTEAYRPELDMLRSCRKGRPPVDKAAAAR